MAEWPPTSHDHAHLLYGLHIASNRLIDGVPHAPPVLPPDLLVTFEQSRDASLARQGTTLIQSSLHSNVEGQPLFMLFRRGNDYVFEFPDGVQFVIEGQATHIRATWPSTLTSNLASIYLVNTVMAFVLRVRGLEVLHASAIAIDDHAIAFIGPSGAGKSTLAACLSRRGHSVITEDVTALVDRGDHFDVLPSHSRIRLWPDSAEAIYGTAFPLPFLAGADWKQYFDLTDGRDALAKRSFRLAAIYSIDDRREGNTPRVESLGESEGLLDLIANTYHSVRDPRLAPANFERIGRLARMVPLRLAIPKSDLRSIFAFADAIVDDFRNVVAPAVARASR